MTLDDWNYDLWGDPELFGLSFDVDYGDTNNWSYIAPTTADPVEDTTGGISTYSTGGTPDAELSSAIYGIIDKYYDEFPVKQATSYSGGYGDRSGEISASGVDMNQAARLEAAAPEILEYLQSSGIQLSQGDKLMNFPAAAQVYELLGMPKE